MKKLLLSKIKKIEILLTDVDCVLTDCGMYYDKRGDSMKKFGSQDLNERYQDQQPFVRRN